MSATSLGWPKRLSGMARSMRARVSSGFGTELSSAPVIGPSMKVGCTELQRTGGFMRAPCSATDLLSSRTPPFEALYAARLYPPTSPETDDRFTIEPPAFFNSGIAYLQPRNVP